MATTLQRAREQPHESSGGLVEHLLAVESFASFRRLSALPLAGRIPPHARRHAGERAAARAPCVKAHLTVGRPPRGVAPGSGISPPMSDPSRPSREPGAELPLTTPVEKQRETIAWCSI